MWGVGGGKGQERLSGCFRSQDDVRFGREAPRHSPRPLSLSSFVPNQRGILQGQHWLLIHLIRAQSMISGLPEQYLFTASWWIVPLTVFPACPWPFPVTHCAANDCDSEARKHAGRSWKQPRPARKGLNIEHEHHCNLRV